MKKFAIALLCILALGACGSDDRSSEEDSTTPANANYEVIDFGNSGKVRHHCDGHGHRVYLTYLDSSNNEQLSVITDPSCPGGPEPTSTSRYSP